MPAAYSTLRVEAEGHVEKTDFGAGPQYNNAAGRRNYGGPCVTAEIATENPTEWLKAVTIMLQREPGYDDNDNWFWVKYAPDGSVMKNPKGMQLAGRVAKGIKAGCISCHLSAEGGDYLFFND
jgi:hypothetical protein